MVVPNTLEFVKGISEDDITIVNGEDTEGTKESPVFRNLFHEYEQVIVRSLITSFGLDMLLFKDRKGGDVDTIHTVRDKSVLDYADKRNEEDYRNRGAYDSKEYHAHEDYIERNREISKQKKSGNLQDAYSGKTLARNAKVDLDHTISAKEVYDDPARVLAELSGPDLANRVTNLNPTDMSINRSKKDKSSDQFIGNLDLNRQKQKERIKELRSNSDLSDKEKKELNKLEKLESVDPQKLEEKDRIARQAYERELVCTYYTSPKFLKATVKASLAKGSKMGLRQCLGLILTEVWFTVKEEFPKTVDKIKDDFNLSRFLVEFIEVIKKAFNNIREKYKELIAAFKNGMLAGILSSISSTLINILFTTVKSVERILRESWASIVESVKILVFNPDNLPFGEMLRAVSKIIATNISIICGSLVQEAVSKMPIIQLPVIANVLPTFIGSLVTGIMSVSMLYFLDHSKIVQRIIEYANQLKDEFDYKLEYYKVLGTTIISHLPTLNRYINNIYS